MVLTDGMASMSRMDTSFGPGEDDENAVSSYEP